MEPLLAGGFLLPLRRSKSGRENICSVNEPRLEIKEVMTWCLSVGPCDNFPTTSRVSKSSFRDRRIDKSTPGRLCISYHHVQRKIVELDLFSNFITAFRVRRVARGVTGISGAALDRVDRVLRPPGNENENFRCENAEKPMQTFMFFTTSRGNFETF
jgi:hypothetical protein